MKRVKLSHGLRALLLSLTVIALAVLLLLGVGSVTGRLTRFDMSDQGYYTLSDESEALLTALDTEVELVLLAVEGSEDLTLQYLLQRYADASEHIDFRVIDPAAESELAAEYAENLRYSNSVAVVSGERSTLVDYSELYVNDYSAFYESGDTGDIQSSFCAERALTGAIRYVTAEELPCLYALTGHGEVSLGEEMLRQLRTEGIRLETLDLSETEAVPSGHGAVLIHAPSYDISEAERDKLAAYLAEGGEMILITAYSGEPLTELNALMEPYGKLTEGLVVEQDRDHYVYGYYDCLVPELAEHELTAALAEQQAYVVLPGCQGILPAEDAAASPLLTTSAAAYASTDLGSVGIKEGDISGPLTVGALIEKGGSRVIWYSSGFMLNETYTQSFGGANEELFLESVRYLCGGTALDIPAKGIQQELLTLTLPQGMALGALVTLVIPLTVVITSAVVVIRRRRRA